MSDYLYGVDLSKPVTSTKARDALIECFTLAHDVELAQALNIEMGAGIEHEEKKKSVTIFIKDVFQDVGGDYENPTKKDLLNVINYLKAFSEHFRDKTVIEKHVREMKEIIGKLP